MNHAAPQIADMIARLDGIVAGLAPIVQDTRIDFAVAAGVADALDTLERGAAKLKSAHQRADTLNRERLMEVGRLSYQQAERRCNERGLGY